MLSGTTNPYIATVNGHTGNTVVVDPTPWFGFTVKEAANLSGYDHFNWFSKIVQLGIGQVPGTGNPEIFRPGTPDLTRVNTLFGRNFGPDPGIGCYSSIFDKCPDGLITDLSPLVYDENLGLLDGRLALKWDDNKANWGLRFTDSPNLVFKGLQAVYETTLVGVRSKGADNPADYDEFTGSTFRWSYTQLGDSPPPELPFGGDGTVQPILFNTDPTKAGIGRIDLLGFGSFADYGLTVTGDIPNNDPIPFPESGGNGNNPGTGSGQSVNEPGALTLFLTGIVSLAFAARRRTRRST